MDQKKKHNRLTKVDIDEISIVDKGAINVPFLLFKRDTGGKETMTLEELQKKVDEALAEKETLSKKIADLEKNVKEQEAKIKEQEIQIGKHKEELEKARTLPIKIKKADMAEDVLVADLQKILDEFKETQEEVLKVGRTFSQKNETSIQAAYDALGTLLTQEAEKRKKKETGTFDIGKAMEEYNAATPEKKKEMEKQLKETAKVLGIKVE